MDAASQTQRLLETLLSSTDAQRRECAQLLQKAGLAAPARVDLPPQFVQKVRDLFGLLPNDPLDQTALIDITVLLFDFVVQLDPRAWRTWRAVTPAAASPSLKLKDALKGYLRGQKDVPAPKDLQNLRMLTVALLNALEKVAGEFFQDHLTVFAPETIEEAVIAEKKGGIFGGRAAACWEKYCELAPGLDRSAVDRAVNKASFNLVYPVVQHLVHKDLLARDGG